MGVQFHAFLTSILDGVELLASNPGHFITKKNPQCSFDSRLGGPQSRSGRCGEDKNPAMPGLEPQPIKKQYQYLDPKFQLNRNTDSGTPSTPDVLTTQSEICF
jgi:hypothetical protein